MLLAMRLPTRDEALDAVDVRLGHVVVVPQAGQPVCHQRLPFRLKDDGMRLRVQCRWLWA
eukprot:scaffold10376_cov131-Isochrysis_galbana.AAC.9